MARKAFDINLYTRGRDGVCPCKDCGEREVGCHSRCESFRDWEKRHRENKKKEQRAAQIMGEAERRKKAAVLAYRRREARR